MRVNPTRRIRIALQTGFCFIVLLVIWVSPVVAGGMLEITELISHPEQYDKQMVVVAGQVTNLQIATNRQGQAAYGFLLTDNSGTVKVIGLGRAEWRDGDQVVVEGIFSRLRQAGRAVVYNEIKVNTIRPVNQLNPDFVG
jgi:hypothetical protein